jgi:hypothetical protein
MYFAGHFLCPFFCLEAHETNVARLRCNLQTINQNWKQICHFRMILVIKMGIKEGKIKFGSKNRQKLGN